MIELKGILQSNFEKITKDATHLFEVQLDKDELWDLYLNAFPKEFNKIFRERRVHDCSACRQFVKNIGNAVVIKDNKVITIWDFQSGSEEYQPSLDKISEFVKSQVISNVYITKTKAIGINKNRENTDSGEILTWEHLFLALPNKFVYHGVKSIGDMQGSYRDVRNVFKRSLDEITEDSLLVSLELIAQNSLYRGEEWQSVLSQFLVYKREYDALSPKERDNYAWAKSVTISSAIGKLRNTSMGTLLIDISNDMDLDIAVRKFEAMVAPSNYKRPKAIFTKKMLEDAKSTMTELGYMESLGRVYATLDDITINNVLFSNKDSAKRMQNQDIFDVMSSSIGVDPKKFSRATEISIEDFVKNVLPTTTELEVLFENRHVANMVSLTAPENKESKGMFKWDNLFGWSYNGNIADSSMKDRVKEKGGKVDGDLRFSIQWNDIGEDIADLDAHVMEADGYELYFSNRARISSCKGRLDVDITRPNTGVPAVENITYANKSSMKDGTYRFFVHDYSGRGFQHGFRAEIEFDGTVHSFDCPVVRRGDWINVAEVTLKNGVFSIVEKLKSTTASKEVWGLGTNQFVPVSVTMFSPNYWVGEKGTGNRHYFFMLKDCINSDGATGFFNEFLKEELTKHRKVFEALGAKMKVSDNADQLSGIGFSSTKRNELIVKVTGQSERVLKIKF